MKRRGGVLYYVTALAMAIGLAVIGVVQLTSAAHAQATRLTELDKVDAAFTAAISKLKDQAMARSLSLPSTNTFTGVDTISVTATATDASATVANAVLVSMTATKDGKTFHKNEYIGYSTASTVVVTSTVTTNGLMVQKGYWPNGAFPYTIGGTNYSDIKGGGQETTDYYALNSTFNWSSTTTAVNPMGISGFWFNVGGYITAPVTGTYTFTTSSDDGYRLWVDGQNIINGWSAHASTRYVSSTINLTAGQNYEIRVEYFDSGGSSVCQLNWLYPGQTETAIPATAMTPLCTHHNVYGDYFMFPVSPRATYLTRATGYLAATLPDAPVVIDLFSLGYAAGNRLTLTSFGSINSSAGVVTGLHAVFASTPKYNIDDTQLNRITNELAAPAGTTAALTSGTGNADSNDWIIPDISAAGGVTITVPTNGRYLFVGAADGAPYSNTVYHGSIYALRIAPYSMITSQQSGSS